ncbi:hypothetical protein ACFPVX_17370 [Cohnella faecalis]|uniref:Uncharacterized protein n=1 Tax=Cohnella faecalis TaxID=2315694 RepID=A0A398CKV3_9BACL|nr:hypothetical protein [Cohnella faecalis]RIE01518.1 hypothetical protein D3H35_24505 [Cohnella faecalis]
MKQQQKHKTITDIARHVKNNESSTFRGRANEAVFKIGKSFDIDYENRAVLNSKKTIEYAFSEKEMHLLAALLAVSKHRPLWHKNRKWENVRISEIFDYHTKLIEEINKMPSEFQQEITADERFEQAEQIQQHVQRIHILVEKLEFLFYLSPAKVGVEILRIVEERVDEFVEGAFEALGEYEKSDALEILEKEGAEVSEEAVREQIKRNTDEKLEKIRTGIDPEVHLLDNLIGDHLKKANDEYTNQFFNSEVQ